MKRVRLVAAAGCVLWGVLGTSAHAVPVTYGEPVAGMGGSVVGSNFDASTHESSFFIPFVGGHAGDFGVGGVGLTSMTATPTSGDHTGSMDLWLRFTPVAAGGHFLSLDFTDLDLFDKNDPAGFLESLAIFDAGGTLIDTVDDVTDPSVVHADLDTQLLGIALTIASDPFFVRLRLFADSEAFIGQKLKNTSEELVGSVYRIAEPSSLALLAAALAGMGFARRRKA